MFSTVYFCLDILCCMGSRHIIFFFFSSRRRQTRCALVTGVQTCALPISLAFPPYFLADIVAERICDQRALLHLVPFHEAGRRRRRRGAAGVARARQDRQSDV